MNETTELLSILITMVGNVQIEGLSQQTLEHVLAAYASPSDIADVWQTVMNMDSKRSSWKTPTLRVLVLLALLRSYEQLQLFDYHGLRTVLGNLRTLTGRPLTVVGTRCELMCRTAEALFLEGRREPGKQTGYLMLSVANELITIVMNDCYQKNNPKYAQRFLGIRGVSRLMLANQEASDAPLRGKHFLDAAADLEHAFRLGNRGASAVAYLLDALLHVLENENDDNTFRRIEVIINSIQPDERRNRAVLTEIGRYWFARSFLGEGNIDSLNTAITCLDNALKYPPVLSHDDAFTRLIRGQALVRLYMSTEGSDPQLAKGLLDDAIIDLKYSFEFAPRKYGNQKSLPSALLTRADSQTRAGNYADAKPDLSYIIDREELHGAAQIYHNQAKFKLLLTELRNALDRNDMETSGILIETIVSYTEFLNQSLVIVGLATRSLFASKTISDDPRLLIKVTDAMQLADLANTDPKSRRMQLSITGRLLFMLGIIWRPESLYDASQKYREAIEASPEPSSPELLAAYGNCCLQLAKFYLLDPAREEQAIDFLEEAGTNLLQAAHAAELEPGTLDDSFKLVVTYSKAGEAFVRLCAYSGLAEDAIKAVESFEKARSLGNETKELLGLEGDALYRLFISTRRPDLLNQAIQYKRMARDAGARNRENFSLSAKLAFMQWEESGDLEDLASAITLVAEAHELSPDWPWPPFQLSEMMSAIEPDDISTPLAKILSEHRNLRLLDIAISNAPDSLIELGCRLVTENSEFMKNLLGGRQLVYVLEDPHRLLSASYVFKHTDAGSALRDRNVVSSFSDFLREHNLNEIRLPTPLAIIPQDDESVVYVMRRATGYHLGRRVIRARYFETSPPLGDFKKALKFLAAFHAWGTTTLPPSAVSVEAFVKGYLRDLKLFSMDLPETTEILLRSLGGVPRLVKKDAHPENWLIDDFGRISMIDFESSKPLPAIFEVVQLIDDYPLLLADSSGYSTRIMLCKEYLAVMDRLSAFPIHVDGLLLENIYQIFAILRCCFGLQRLRRTRGRTSSSSSLRAERSRTIHYQAMLEWLASTYSVSGVQDLAAAAISKLQDIPSSRSVV